MEEVLIETPSSILAVRTREGAGPPIVFLSGYGMPDYLQDIAAMCTGRFVVTYDQRGTGASRALDGDYSVSAYVADLEAIRKELGVEGLHVFGHSWGGLLAQLYAIAHPDRTLSLFLSNPATGVGSHWAAMERSVLRYTVDRCTPLGFAVLALWLVMAWAGPGAVGRWALRKAYTRVWLNYQDPADARPANPAVIDGAGRVTALRTRKSIMSLPDDHLDGSLPTAGIPMQIVYGERDIFGSHIDEVRERYPAATFEVWAGCRHIPWLDDLDRFRDALRAFFRLR